MTEPRIVTPKEAQERIRRSAWGETPLERDYVHTVATEDVRYRNLTSERDHLRELVTAVVRYDEVNQSDLPLGLLDSLRASVGAPR